MQPVTEDVQAICEFLQTSSPVTGYEPLRQCYRNISEVCQSLTDMEAGNIHNGHVSDMQVADQVAVYIKYNTPWLRLLEEALSTFIKAASPAERPLLEKVRQHVVNVIGIGNLTDRVEHNHNDRSLPANGEYILRDLALTLKVPSLYQSIPPLAAG